MKIQNLIKGVLTLITISTISLVVYAETQIFNATNEWQQVPENVHLPAGLHVRMDLSKGGKWAKLMNSSDEDPEPQGASEIVVTRKQQAAKRDYQFAKNKVETALSSIVAEKEEIEDDSESAVNGSIFKDLSAIDKEDLLKYKRTKMEKLKAQVNDFMKSSTSDFEKMNKLVKTLEQIDRDKVETDLYTNTCEDLDMILSKVDNAIDAAHHGILSRLINLYKIAPSKGIWRIFSSSAQNNGPVAKALFPHLKPILEESISNLDVGSPLLKSAVYTLSAIARSIPISDQLKIDWNTLLNSHNKNNQYLCTLLNDLTVPYSCSMQPQKSEL